MDTFWSHSVTAIPVDGQGRLKDSWTRVPMPEDGFPHSVVPHPIRPDLYVANRTANCIVRLTSADGTIRRDGSAAVVPDTARGVRHLVVDPTGTRMFSTDEESSTVTAYRLDADGMVHPIGSVRTVPDGWPDPNYPADLALDPGRQLLFVANRGHDSVAVFDVADELPRPAGHLSVGRGPRNLSLDPEGGLLAVGVLREDVVLLARLGDSGLDLDPRSVPVPTPSGLLLVPTGRAKER
jgi:6-phosphogluconolactonase